MYVRVHMSMYVYIYVCVCVCTYTYIDTHAQTPFCTVYGANAEGQSKGQSDKRHDIHKQYIHVCMCECVVKVTARVTRHTTQIYIHTHTDVLTNT